MLRNLVYRLWDDDQGQLITIEFLFFAVILIIGIIPGLVILREAIKIELTELANAILALNPGFVISGNSGCCAEVSGSQAIVIPAQIPFPICTPPAFPVVIVPPTCPVP